MVDELGFENADAAKNAWRPQFAKYNQTLKALRSGLGLEFDTETYWTRTRGDPSVFLTPNAEAREALRGADAVSSKKLKTCLLYTSPSPRD